MSAAYSGAPQFSISFTILSISFFLAKMKINTAKLVNNIWIRWRSQARKLPFLDIWQISIYVYISISHKSLGHLGRPSPWDCSQCPTSAEMPIPQGPKIHQIHQQLLGWIEMWTFANMAINHSQSWVVKMALFEPHEPRNDGSNHQRL